MQLNYKNFSSDQLSLINNLAESIIQVIEEAHGTRIEDDDDIIASDEVCSLLDIICETDKALYLPNA
jgi:hypothetical protein